MLDSVPTRRRRRRRSRMVLQATTEEEEFQIQFERECSLIGCCSTVEMPSSDWYIDSGASSHMSGVREHFTDLRDPEIRLEIVLGDDTVVRAVGRGTISFQRECMPPLVFRDVLFVPGLKKNLVSVSSLQDRGLEVSFRGTEVLIHPKGSSITHGRVIGTREGNLYRLLFQPLCALMSSNNNNSQLCELWHWRIAHLHYGALRSLREIVMGMPQFNIEHQEVCRECTLGEYTESVFPSSDSRSVGVLGATRSMLHDQALPVYLWEDACSTAVYLQFRSPHRALGRKTLEEAFSGSRPDVEHLAYLGA
jgi:hypothetical protein